MSEEEEVEQKKIVVEHVGLQAEKATSIVDQEKEELKETKIKHIEQYREFLQKELAGVNEYLDKLQKD